MLEHVEPALIDQYHSSTKENGYNVFRFVGCGCVAQFRSPHTALTDEQLTRRRNMMKDSAMRKKISESMKAVCKDPAKKEQRRLWAMGNRSRTGQKQSIEERAKHKLPEQIISLAKQLRVEGIKHSEIADRLNNQGYTNKYNHPWTTKAVSGIFERVRKE